MDIIHNYLLNKGFIITPKTSRDTNLNTTFLYSFIIEDFAEYNVIITSYNNWVFRMETEKKSFSQGVVGFSNHTCFFGVISSVNSIQILETVLNATGINSILENHMIDKLFKDE